MAKRVIARGARILIFCGAAFLFSAGLLLPSAFASKTTNGCGSCTGCNGAGGTCSATNNCAASCGCNDDLGYYVCNRTL